ncbi:MAG: PPC domain-containing DNA-binding protein [Pseudomonadota bacterium]
MTPLPVRLMPGADVRTALAALLAEHGVEAAYVVQGMGSLDGARLRFAGQDQVTALTGDLEILTLAGTLSPDGVHLHMSVSDGMGRVTGGHVAAGCTVRTTAEILVMLLPGRRFRRVPDAGTGYDELFIA